ncbi:MAG: acyl-CoA dehydrogenase [Dehalococcoidia bacterium]|nr:acyl-CoA dehydrogenase [Dehalococcoidia bacterium]
MDFRFSEGEEGFRREVREFLDAELAPEDEGEPFDIRTEEKLHTANRFMKKLAGRGWIAMHWPKEYGGYGASVMEQLIYNEEMAYRRAPLVNQSGTNMVGPTLIVYGSEEQKTRHLPGITNAEVIWSQGYSEPQSGSDLASLQTRAVRDGDDYVINGQKIWTSNAHHSQWMFLLARTDPEAPKHKGISFFLLDMESPGVEVRPLLNVAGQKGFNEVFFENVRVPAENLVGEENRGWYIGATLLDFERSNVSGAATARRDLEELVAYAAAERRDGGSLLDAPQARHQLAEMAIEIEVGRGMSYRVASIQDKGGIPNHEASMAKLFHSEVAQRLANLGARLLRLHGGLREESKHARLAGKFTMEYMNTLGAAIAGGTSEIQRNVMATRGLGLPRG